VQQIQMEFPKRGGKRDGAGRKPAGQRARVSHEARPEHKSRHPLHVTVRVADRLPSLRGVAEQQVLRRVLEETLHANTERTVAEQARTKRTCRKPSAAERAAPRGLRLIHFSAQSNHLHLIGEAEDKEALARGMKGFAVRLARALNRLWRRTGAVFADRYHSRALKTPREVRNVLAYVFSNARKHGVWLRELLDPCSSAAAFDGWRERPLAQDAARREPHWLARARTWLLTLGWKRHGLLSIRGP
jgi:putative transposase